MRKIVAALAVLLLAAFGWWYASPLWTLHAMRDAATHHDAARLSAYVDYPAVRAKLKSDLGGDAARVAASHPGDGGAQLGAAIAAAFLGPVIDALVTPEGVAAMFARQDRAAANGATAAPQPTGKALPVSAPDHPVIEREGLDRFRVHDKDPGKGALEFRRSGLGWKLVGVDLPSPIV